MPIRLLCIDDDRPTQDLLQTLAEDEGWQHLPVLHPDRAFALVDSAAPDVILLDLMLPGVADVGELAARLRAHFGAAPLVILSGRADAAALAERIGATAYLAKPFDVDVLVSTISACVAATGLADRPTESAPLDTAPGEPLAV